MGLHRLDSGERVNFPIESIHQFGSLAKFRSVEKHLKYTHQTKWMTRYYFDSHAQQIIRIAILSSSKNHWTFHSLNPFQLNEEERKKYFVNFLGKKYKFLELFKCELGHDIGGNNKNFAWNHLWHIGIRKSAFRCYDTVSRAVNKNMNANIMFIQTHFQTITSDCSAYMLEIGGCFLRLAKAIEKHSVQNDRENDILKQRECWSYESEAKKKNEY